MLCPGSFAHIALGASGICPECGYDVGRHAGLQCDYIARHEVV